MKSIQPGYYIVYWTAEDPKVELAWYGRLGYGEDRFWYRIGSDVSAWVVFKVVRKVRAKLPKPWAAVWR